MHHSNAGPEYPTLKNPPIIEGLLDLQFDLEPSMLSRIESLGVCLPDYPNKAPKIAVAGNVQLGDSGASFSHDRNVVGYQFWNNDKTRVFQARLNGITLSFLKPYTRFEDLEAEARRLWGLFCSRLERPIVKRVALRYINHIDLPLPFEDFRELIKTFPEIPPAIPQGIAEFFMRLVIPDPDSSCTAIVTEVMEKQTRARSTIPLLLDIDVFQVPKDNHDDRLWAIVQELREYKNRIFFNSVTPRLMKVFDE